MRHVYFTGSIIDMQALDVRMGDLVQQALQMSLTYWQLPMMALPIIQELQYVRQNDLELETRLGYVIRSKPFGVKLRDPGS